MTMNRSLAARLLEGERLLGTSVTLPSPEVAERTRGYLRALTLALPAALLFTVFRSFTTAVSRPKPVMLLQLGGLSLKIPLTIALVNGWPAIGLPSLAALSGGGAGSWGAGLGAAVAASTMGGGGGGSPAPAPAPSSPAWPGATRRPSRCDRPR